MRALLIDCDLVTDVVCLKVLEVLQCCTCACVVLGSAFVSQLSCHILPTHITAANNYSVCFC